MTIRLLTTARYLVMLYRPRTLLLSLSPILLSQVLAYLQGSALRAGTVVAIVLTALLIQMATNAYNDARDFEKGADTLERLGMPRVTAQGLLSVAWVKGISHLTFALAFLSLLYLVWIGGWVILLLGLLCIAAGYAYTGGPMPIAYSPLGEVFVIVFFGLVAVGGGFYLQTGQYHWIVAVLSLALGLLAANVLSVNNYRDADTDALVGKATLAVRAGRAFILKLFLAFHLGAFALVVTVALLTQQYFLLGILICLPLAWHLHSRLAAQKIGTQLNEELALAVKYQFLFTLALCFLLLLPSLLTKQ